MIGKKETCIVREGSLNFEEAGNTYSIPVYFIDNYHYFDRPGIYCYGDDGDRFAFFDKAVLKMLPRIGFKPDVIHCNDWQTGIIPLYLKETYKEDAYYNEIASLYTIHNLQYQGNFDKGILPVLGLNEEFYTSDKLEFYGQVNLMKAGILYGDIINTVSKTYVEEIKTQEYGERLNGLLKYREGSLYGIVNGIDTVSYNPADDEKIYKKYDIKTIHSKSVNKKKLQIELGFPDLNVPLIGMVTRLVDQKGLEIITQIMPDLLKADMQLIVLGLGDPYYENIFRKYEKDYPGKVSANIEFNDALAHKIYAGADMFLMPSKFEPCGLGQLIALRYGTVPIVRKTGGLADTVEDFKIEKEEGNGFTFKEYSGRALMKTMIRAMSIYKNMPDIWEKIMQAGMEEDFSWKHVSDNYIELYHKAIDKVF
jgi:starch synthase